MITIVSSRLNSGILASSITKKSVVIYKPVTLVFLRNLFVCFGSKLMNVQFPVGSFKIYVDEIIHQELKTFSDCAIPDGIHVGKDNPIEV